MTPQTESRPTIPTRAAIALGIGSMVGAGIFALLGVAATRAGSALWLSFLAAGLIALLTGHSFAELGIRYPSRGGVVQYLAQAFGPGLFSGGSSILYYIAQLIGMAMISLSFGRFVAQLLNVAPASADSAEKGFASALILGLMLLNLVGSKLVAVAQRLIVLVNLGILTLFTVALAFHAEPSRLAVSTWPEPAPILGSLALTFFGFTGFAVVSNAVERLREPRRDLPRAMYGSIGLVLLLYVALAAVVSASVDAQTLSGSGATLLADVARQNFGEAGYYLLLVVAILATVTCLNSGLFGVTGITYTLAVNGQLPSRFQKSIGFSTRGLTISAAIGLTLVNTLSLTTVASIGSATSLLVYSLVNVGAVILLPKQGLHRVITLASVAACGLAIVVWIAYTAQTKPSSFGIFLAFTAAAFIAEALLQRFHKRRGRLAAG
ncbi:APC family permease [Synechococcus sp. RSCCF101]|uniref:APC family permease n=1 Tax=Synechococcus sp. RSCCF101 TaxID=2511069 RepID=UPI0012448BBB|nr:APC family permease [Synechococcus sp. RSCCF101]QEY31004.1 APC family permease [Synechococcus sp. RSCCF101]